MEADARRNMESDQGQGEGGPISPLSLQRMEELLLEIRDLRVGVIGDVCLDAYWEADMTRSTLSRETPHYTLPVAGERYSPGAAGNVAANLRALGCSEVFVCSAIGNDWRGLLLQEQFALRGIDTTFLSADDGWTTPAYCKPIRIGMQGSRQEDPRLDFQNFRPLQDDLAVKLAARLDAMAERCDAIAVTDQLLNGVVGETIRRKLTRWAQAGKIVVVDSRDNIGAYRGAIVKPNEVEAGNWLTKYGEITAGESSGMQAFPEDHGLAHWSGLARRLEQETGGPCCLTLGAAGAIWAEQGEAAFIPTREVEPPIDIVGAGDAFASALACALAAGAVQAEAVAFAHLASAVVIRKLGTTGTASPQEMLDERRRGE